METEVLGSNDYRQRHAVRPGEIVIEIDNEHVTVYEETRGDAQDPFNPLKSTVVRREVLGGNRHEQFPPVDVRKNGTNFIRTRQVLVREGKPIRFSMDQALMDIEFIPGERIHIDMEKRIGRITDALADAEHNELYNKLIYASQNMQKSQKFPFIFGEYHEVDLSKSESAFWNWIWYMRQICDGDHQHNAGSAAHPGCATKGPRRCRPIQNVDLLPTRIQCAASLKVRPSVWLHTKEWDEDLKGADPNYSKPRGDGRVGMTPYLAETLQEAGV